MATTDLTIIIVSFNTRDSLRECLRSLSTAAEGLSSTAIVVDNDSQDGSAEMVSQYFPTVQLIKNSANLGFSRACNQAIEHAEGRFIVLLNPDTKPLPESLSCMVDRLNHYPEAGAAGPSLIFPNGSRQGNGGPLPNIGTEIRRLLGIRKKPIPAPLLVEGSDHKTMEGHLPDVIEVEQVSGACIMVRRTAIQQIGLLDEDFFMFYEEVDWCRRMIRAGWKVYLIPEAVVIHQWMGSVRQRSREMARQFYRSQRLYYRKNGSLLTKLIIGPLSWLGTLKSEARHIGSHLKRILTGGRSINVQ